jgi:hypothetical protein
LVKLASITSALILAALVGPSAHAMTASGEASTSRALVASARRDEGRSALRLDARLERIARAQSEEMARRGAIYHNPKLGDEATAAGVDWRWVGENVGVGPDARLIHDGFMNSPHHHEVLMRPDANAFGIAAAIADDGRLYITQVFAKVVSAPEPAVAVSAPMRAAPVAVVPSAPAPKPAIRIETPDPNVVIGGVVPHGLSALDARRPGVTRSGLRAS